MNKPYTIHMANSHFEVMNKNMMPRFFYTAYPCRLKSASAIANRLKPCYHAHSNLLEQVSHTRLGIHSMLYDPPLVILDELAQLETEIQDRMAELREMLA